MRNQLAVILFAALMMTGVAASAQTTVKRDGNTLTQVKSDKATSEAQLTRTAEKTELTFKTPDGITYPVWKSSEGNLFIVRVSKKSGNSYKQYLKEEGK